MGSYDYLIKLMLIGDSGMSLLSCCALDVIGCEGVGKSSLLLRFSDDSFGDLSRLSSTSEMLTACWNRRHELYPYDRN